MARGKGRGGYQAPSKPAAASGPGSLSKRTDSQPQRAYTGLPYGDNKAVNDQQAAAPLPQNGPPGAAPVRRGGPPAYGPDGIFGPSDYPGQPMTTGVDFGPGEGAGGPSLEEDPNLLLRAIVSRYPHPDLVRLLSRG